MSIYVHACWFVHSRKSCPILKKPRSLSFTSATSTTVKWTWSNVASRCTTSSKWWTSSTSLERYDWGFYYGYVKAIEYLSIEQHNKGSLCNNYLFSQKLNIQYLPSVSTNLVAHSEWIVLVCCRCWCGSCILWVKATDGSRTTTGDTASTSDKPCSLCSW